MKRALLLMMAVAGAAQSAFCQRPVSARAYSFSSMKYLEQDDDITGWDVFLLSSAQGVDGILYCGLTDVQGPVRVHLSSMVGRQTVQPENAVCGATLVLEFKAGVLLVTGKNGVVERVPRHTNFLSEEKFR